MRAYNSEGKAKGNLGDFKFGDDFLDASWKKNISSAKGEIKWHIRFVISDIEDILCYNLGMLINCNLRQKVVLEMGMLRAKDYASIS